MRSDSSFQNVCSGLCSPKSPLRIETGLFRAQLSVPCLFEFLPCLLEFGTNLSKFIS